MKKLMFIMMAAAAISLVSCKKDNADNVDKSDTVTWGGVTYKTVKLKDGRTIALCAERQDGFRKP